jgi:excisionase family DNA binding protein
MEPELLNARELSERLRVQLPTVYYLARIGKLPAIRNGGRWLFPWAEIRDQFALMPQMACEHESNHFTSHGAALLRGFRAPRMSTSPLIAIIAAKESAAITGIMSWCLQRSVLPMLLSDPERVLDIRHLGSVKVLFLGASDVSGPSESRVEAWMKALSATGEPPPSLAVTLNTSGEQLDFSAIPSGLPLLLCPMPWTEATTKALDLALVEQLFHRPELPPRALRGLHQPRGQTQDFHPSTTRRASDSWLISARKNPRLNRTTAHIAAKEWNLTSPTGAVFHFRNLKQFIREHMDLFPPSDVVWKQTGPRHLEWCTAFQKLARLRPGRANRIVHWRGWRWCERSPTDLPTSAVSLSR